MPEKGVASTDDALEGARHIILAEMINEDETARSRLRALFAQNAVIVSRSSRARRAKGAKFKDYFDWQEPAAPFPRTGCWPCGAASARRCCR
jgi:protein Tex